MPALADGPEVVPVAGLVLDAAAGKGIPGATVTIGEREPLTTDEHGEWRASLAPATKHQSHRAWVRAEGPAPVQLFVDAPPGRGEIRFRIPESGVVDCGTIALKTPEMKVETVVIHERSQGIPGACMAIRGRHDATGLGGRVIAGAVSAFQLPPQVLDQPPVDSIRCLAVLESLRLGNGPEGHATHSVAEENSTFDPGTRPQNAQATPEKVVPLLGPGWIGF